MYYTLTFNPSLDHYVWFKTALVEGAILRPFQSALKVGGKGLNINQNFAKLKIPSKSFVFLAGDVGQMIYNKISKIPMIETEAFWIKGESRINIKILGEKETAINEPGPLIDEGAKRELLKSLKKLDVNDFLIIAGSLAFNVDLNYLLEIKSTCKAKRVLDIPNLSFLDLSRLKPDLIKPNLEELGAIFEEEVSIDNYRCYTRKLIIAGVKSVLLSLGEMGSYFESDKEVLSVANSIQPDIINGLICSGDKFIASAEEINEIKSHFPDVMAVDMESATIAQVCYLKQTKVFIMRVISDTPGAEHDNSKQYENFWESAPEHTFEALAQILNKLG